MSKIDGINDKYKEKLDGLNDLGDIEIILAEWHLAILEEDFKIWMANNKDLSIPPAIVGDAVHRAINDGA